LLVVDTEDDEEQTDSSEEDDADSNISTTPVVGIRSFQTFLKLVFGKIQQLVTRLICTVESCAFVYILCLIYSVIIINFYCLEMKII